MIQKVLYLTPAIALLVLSTALELEDIAESSSEKAVRFARDMDTAIDCATTATELSACSPGIFNEDFKEETEGLMRITGQVTKDRSALLPGDYILKKNDDGTFVVIPEN